MEQTSTAAVESAPAVQSISAELDSMFEGVGASDSGATETSSEAAPTSPQDSTVQPAPPPELKAEDRTVEEEAATTETTEPAVEAAAETVPVAEEDRAGEEYEIRGKKWIRYPEARGKEVFAGYQTSKALAKELGLAGPATPEHIQSLARDKALLDGIDFDAMSADPADQARAFRYLFSTARKAYEGGHTGHNPHETMADALLHAASSTAPDVVAGLEHHFTQQAFNRLYDKAVAVGLDTDAGKALLASAQRAEQALTGDYRKRADLAKQTADPMSARARELDAKQQRIDEFESNRAQHEWKAWNTGTNAAIDSGVSGTITNILKPVVDSLKQFPETQKNVEIRLRTEIKDALAADQRFKSERERFFKQAGIAGNESIRDSWRARIVQLYTAKAEQVLREKAPAILSESARAVKAKSDKTHERLKGSQQLRGTPAGGVAPNGATAPSAANGKFDSRSWANEFEAAFN